MPWFLRMTIRISLLALPLYIYVGWRLSTAISTRFPVSRKTARMIVFSVIFWLYLFPITIGVYYGSGILNQLFVFDTQLHWQDYLLLFPFWLGFISLLEIFPFFVVLDIICLVSRLKMFSFRKKWLVWQAYLKICIVIFFLLYVGMRSYLDTHYVGISTYNAAVKKLPEAFHNLRLCFISDIHVDRYTQTKKLEKVEERVHAADSDLLFFSGDLVSEGRDYLTSALDVMCHPSSKLGSIACMGDHDFWSAARTIPREMKKCGWTFLQNEHHLISYKGHQILVTGVTNIYSRRIQTYELERLLSNAPNRNAHLKILLVHQPRDFMVEIAAKYGYHLLLAGHTHGGQIVPHLFGIPITPSQTETRFYRGRYQYNGMHVIVTNGIGLTLAPLRYHAPAEITGIILVKGDENER